MLKATKRLIRLLAAIILVNLFGIPVKAQITPDTGAGATGTTITSPNGNPNQFDIGGGKTAGQNLFHSFGDFNLSQPQIANFLSNPGVQNILGRVTGGNPSIINGIIQSTGSNANLFLINPAGVIFGSSASLNVNGSFTATTANRVGIGNGFFNAAGANDYTSLTGIPNALDFTSAKPGAIVNNGNLGVTQGNNLALVGGTVLNTGSISAPGGTVTLASVPGSSMVRLGVPGNILGLEIESKAATTASPLSLPELLTGPLGTEITTATGLQNTTGGVKLASGTVVPATTGVTATSGTIDVSGTTGGTVGVIGTQVGLLDSAQINASGTNGGGTVLVGGNYKGEGTVPTADFSYISPNAIINASATTAGDGGKVIQWANDQAIFGGKIFARGGAVSGDGGFVETSGKLGLLADGTVDTGAPNGTAGTWLLDPLNISIVDSTNNNVSANSPFTPTGTSSQVTVATIQGALGTGNVTVTTNGTVGAEDGDIIVVPNATFTTANTLTLTAAGLVRNSAQAPTGAKVTVTGGGSLILNILQDATRRQTVAGNPATPSNAIQQAINILGTGSSNPAVVNVPGLANGAYYLSAALSVPVELKGPFAATPVSGSTRALPPINSTTAYVPVNEAVIVGNGFSATGPIASVSVDGFTFTGTPTAVALPPINLSTVPVVNFRNNIVTISKGVLIGGPFNTATVTGNWLGNITGDAVPTNPPVLISNAIQLEAQTGGLGNATVSNNIINTVAGGGIVGNGLQNSTIGNNIIIDTAGPGIEVGDGSRAVNQLTIQGNQITRANQGAAQRGLLDQGGISLGTNLSGQTSNGISNVSITGNTINNQGVSNTNFTSGISLRRSTGGNNLNLTNITISNNSITNHSRAGIYTGPTNVVGTVALDNNIISNNVTGIEVRGANANITAGTVQLGQTGIININRTTNINNANINNNTIAGVSNQGGAVTVTQSTFTNNNIGTSNNATNANTSISNSSFTNNLNSGVSTSAGATILTNPIISLNPLGVVNAGTGVTTITNGTIANNTNTGVQNVGGTVQINNVNLQTNQIGVVNNGGNTTITNSTFNSNVIAGLINQSGSVTITNATNFSGNNVGVSNAGAGAITSIAGGSAFSNHSIAALLNTSGQLILGSANPVSGVVIQSNGVGLVNNGASAVTSFTNTSINSNTIAGVINQAGSVTFVQNNVVFGNPVGVSTSGGAITTIIPNAGNTIQNP